MNKLIVFDVEIQNIGWITLAVKDYATLSDVLGERLIQAQDTMRHFEWR